MKEENIYDQAKTMRYHTTSRFKGWLLRRPLYRWLIRARIYTMIEEKKSGVAMISYTSVTLRNGDIIVVDIRTKEEGTKC
jgi:hypothetical protein